MRRNKKRKEKKGKKRKEGEEKKSREGEGTDVPGLGLPEGKASQELSLMLRWKGGKCRGSPSVIEHLILLTAVRLVLRSLFGFRELFSIRLH